MTAARHAVSRQSSLQKSDGEPGFALCGILCSVKQERNVVDEGIEQASISRRTTNGSPPYRFRKWARWTFRASGRCGCLTISSSWRRRGRLLRNTRFRLGPRLRQAQSSFCAKLPHRRRDTRRDHFPQAFSIVNTQNYAKARGRCAQKSRNVSEPDDRKRPAITNPTPLRISGGQPKRPGVSNL